MSFILKIAYFYKELQCKMLDNEVLCTCYVWQEKATVAQGLSGLANEYLILPSMVKGLNHVHDNDNVGSIHGISQNDPLSNCYNYSWKL